MKASIVTSAETTKICNGYSDVFTGTRCFRGTLTLQVRDDVKSYQVLPRHIAYASMHHKNHSKRARKTTRVPNTGAIGSG